MKVKPNFKYSKGWWTVTGNYLGIEIKSMARDFNVAWLGWLAGCEDYLNWK